MLNREDATFIATIGSAAISVVGAIGTWIGAWHAREANKRRGRHRRR